MRSLWQNLRYAIRVFANRPAFTAIAVLMLALGIGANTSIFSLVNALLLRPLPFREPGRVVMVDEWNGQWGGCGQMNFLDWRRQNTVFEGLAAMGGAHLTLTGSGDPERVRGSEVTANFLSLLGVRPLLGRGFLPGEDSPGQDQVVLLSYGLWQRRFGARPDIVGQSLKLDGGERSVVGVLPPDYPFPDSEVLIPMTIDPADMPRRRGAGPDPANGSGGFGGYGADHGAGRFAILDRQAPDGAVPRRIRGLGAAPRGGGDLRRDFGFGEPAHARTGRPHGSWRGTHRFGAAGGRAGNAADGRGDPHRAGRRAVPPG